MFFNVNSSPLYVWATYTLTSSYTRITSVQVQTLLVAFPRIAAVATPQPNLDSALSIKKCFLLRERRDSVFKSDYVSTIIPQTNGSIDRTLISLLVPLLSLLGILSSQILRSFRFG